MLWIIFHRCWWCFKIKILQMLFEEPMQRAKTKWANFTPKEAFDTVFIRSNYSALQAADASGQSSLSWNIWENNSAAAHQPGHIPECVIQVCHRRGFFMVNKSQRSFGLPTRILLGDAELDLTIEPNAKPKISIMYVSANRMLYLQNKIKNQSKKYDELVFGSTWVKKKVIAICMYLGFITIHNG